MGYRFTMSGKRRTEYVAFFEGKGGKREGEERLFFKCWQVWIGPEKTVSLGSIQVPEVEVLLDLFGTDSRVLLEEFRRVFLTAGG